MLVSLSWSRARLGEAVRALARRAGMEVGNTSSEAPPPSADLSAWLDATARTLGVEAVRLEVRKPELASFFRASGPSIVKLPDGRFLLVLGSGSRHLRVLTEGGEMRKLATAVVVAALEGAEKDDIARLVERLPLDGARRDAVERALRRERMREETVSDLWLLRVHPGARPVEIVRQARLARLAGVFVSTYAIDYTLFLVSWWLLGRGALRGQIEAGWLVAWALLFATMLPFRMLSTWYAGKVAVAAGALLKQRLLLGAMRLAPDELRADGAGRHLARVFESEAVESLALTGGLLSVAASVELVVALAVLIAGAGGVPQAALLAGLLVLVAFEAVGYLRDRRRWTDERLAMSHELVDRMVGHRTRLAQLRPERWHEGEDEALTTYATLAREMDRKAAALWITPRLWLPMGLFGLSLPFIRGTASLGALAVALGGMILAARALEKLSAGFAHLVDAAIAWQRVAPTFHAAGRTPAPGDPVLAVASSASKGVLLEASELAFRYPSRPEPVLQGVRFRVERGDRVLLTSPSGGGKSTLVSLLNGLRQPASGMLLLDGVDRGSLGVERWSRLVATAPQFHENHVFTESFAFNLLMGRAWPPTVEDLEEAEALCGELGLEPLLEKMPGGMNQLVGDTGWQLSHGERSRLFLARALLQGGELTLLDESFAALDPDNLRQALICARERAKSLVVVAHI